MFNNANANIQAEEALENIRIRQALERTVREELLAIDLDFTGDIDEARNNIDNVVREMDRIIMNLGPDRYNPREGDTKRALSSKSVLIGLAIKQYEIRVLTNNINEAPPNESPNNLIERIGQLINELFRERQYGNIRNLNREGKFDLLLSIASGCGMENEALTILRRRRNRGVNIEQHKEQKRHDLKELLKRPYILELRQNIVVPQNNNPNNNNGSNNPNNPNNNGSNNNPNNNGSNNPNNSSQSNNKVNMYNNNLYMNANGTISNGNRNRTSLNE